MHRERYAGRSCRHGIFLRACMHSFLSVSCKVYKGGLHIARRFPYASVPHRKLPKIYTDPYTFKSLEYKESMCRACKRKKMRV